MKGKSAMCVNVVQYCDDDMTYINKYSSVLTGCSNDVNAWSCLHAECECTARVNKMIFLIYHISGSPSQCVYRVRSYCNHDGNAIYRSECCGLLDLGPCPDPQVGRHLFTPIINALFRKEDHKYKNKTHVVKKKKMSFPFKMTDL